VPSDFLILSNWLHGNKAATEPEIMEVGLTTLSAAVQAVLMWFLRSDAD